jgi:hypothetical protein
MIQREEEEQEQRRPRGCGAAQAIDTRAAAPLASYPFTPLS